MATWIDDVTEDVLKRNDKKYLITDYKTPSGKIHVGALRGVVVHDVIYHWLLENNQEVEYWYGYDDFDPMDGLPIYLSKEKYHKHMGEPLCNIPSPKEGFKNFADYFAQDFLKVYHELGIKPKTVWGSELYKTGKYNQAIKIILDNAEKIRKIYLEVSGGKKPDDWYAFNVVCPNCGKIGTTRVFDWDGQEVSFICEPKMVEWAEGCSYQGKISPFDGNGKMPYKVETPAKWFTFGTSVELAGKDHYTKGGSFDVAKKIARDIFKINPAFGLGYEWFLVDGKKMSTSKGVGASVEEISQMLPAELLKFLMVRTRPQRAIDFNPFGETIPKLYDEFDHCLDEFLIDSNSDFGKYYHFSNLTSKELIKYRLRFSKVAYLLQMPRVDLFNYAQEEKGSKLTTGEKSNLETRIEFAKKWLAKYAPDSYKFNVLEKFPDNIELRKEQKDFINKIAILLKEKKWTGEELHSQIHQIKKDMNLDARLVFSAIYQLLLGKDSGPQAGWLIASLDRDFVIDRFIIK